MVVHLKNLALVIAAGFLFVGCTSTNVNEVESPNAQNTANSTTSSQATTSNTTPSTEITLEEVAQHASADDCWMVIEGKVYDVTSFVDSHPGGAQILTGCGTDATDIFNSIGSHQNSTDAENQKEKLYIGDLAN